MLNLGAFPVEFRTSAFVGLEPFDRDALDALALGAGAEFVGDPCAHCTALRCVACGRLVRFRLVLFVLSRNERAPTHVTKQSVYKSVDR